jgi:hypothetical protein
MVNGWLKMATRGAGQSPTMPQGSSFGGMASAFSPQKLR